VTELTDTFQTDTAGHFVLPYAGEMNAAGHTAGELAAMIDARLRGTYIRDSHVAVNIDDASSVVFTVDGQVTQPGSYTMTGNMTLMRAVAAAKGLSEYARLDDVVVFRTVDGKPMAALYNLGAIRRGTYPDPRIYVNDLVVDGDSKARRQFAQYIETLPILTTPLILALERLRLRVFPTTCSR
jgi:polysaccharide export outer membrane protein